MELPFAKKWSRKLSFLPEELANEEIFLLGEISDYIKEKATSGDLVYIQNCSLLPLFWDEQIKYIKLNYFEPRPRFYRRLLDVYNEDIDQKEESQSWRAFQLLTGQGVLEGAPSLNRRKKNSSQLEALHHDELTREVSIDEKAEKLHKEFLIKGETPVYGSNLEDSAKKKANMIMVLLTDLCPADNYGARIKLEKFATKIFSLYSKYLIIGGKLVFLVQDADIFLGTLFQEGARQGWRFSESREIYEIWGNYIFCVFSRGGTSRVYGSLKRLEEMNNLDIENSIIREIGLFLQDKKVTSYREIRKHLIYNFPHRLPKRSLQELLMENFAGNKSIYFDLRKELNRSVLLARIEEKLPSILGEICYRLLMEKKNFLSYEDLFYYIKNLKLRNLFYHPYVFLFSAYNAKEGVEKEPGVLLADIIGNPKRIRKIINRERQFCEFLPGIALGNKDWSPDLILSKYLQLLASIRRGDVKGNASTLKKRCSEYIFNEQYFSDLEKKKIITFLKGKSSFADVKSIIG